jgi:hypothetical protein
MNLSYFVNDYLFNQLKYINVIRLAKCSVFNYCLIKFFSVTYYLNVPLSQHYIFLSVKRP